ncbi:hypothetical protein AB0J28_10665 [Streptosporangium canum]|uniref:hypothetical protein n=1 Tax=Streptosporangium canum TaxID=324952 RepID=UPI003444D4DC
MSMSGRPTPHKVVVFADGGVRASALTIWTAGFGVPELAAASGLRTDALGRLLTDETLNSVDDDRIVAAGDAAAPSGRPLRMSSQAAQPLGAQAANTVLSRIAGTEPAVIDQAPTGVMRQPGPARRHATARPQRRHRDERLLRRPHAPHRQTDRVLPRPTSSCRPGNQDRAIRRRLRKAHPQPSAPEQVRQPGPRHRLTSAPGANYREPSVPTSVIR